MTTLNESYVNSFKINRLTKTQLNNATELSPSEAYWEDPEFVGGKLLATDNNGDIVESSQTIPTKTSDLTNDSGFITSSALSGYATETWVGQQGFLTSTALNGYATQQWVGQQGYITGITSSDVTTALGYTPYNSSNPSGYQANVIETVKVNGTALTPSSKAVDITVPTNNNQLTNGAGYITSSALTGYATETWVGQQGFLTSTALNGYATESWVGQQGYITGITSSDVTTALGYSPVNPTSLASVATSGSYNDLSNKPTIPAAQVNSDWNANSGVAQILNKPTLATVATTGAYSDLSGKPTIPTVNNPTITITQGGVTKGSFTLNQSTGDTIALDAGGGGSLPSQTGNAGKFLTTDGTDASWGVPSSFKLFHHDWFDYQLNDQSWLRADTFSWQDGTVYSDAYSHLVADYNGGTSQTETVGSYTITYVLATDGHKITTDETNVANIYNESGVAWYYILDTTNQRFKLPRTKYGFVGLRDTVGKYVPETLPNITGRAGTMFQQYDNLPTGAFATGTSGWDNKGSTGNTGYSFTFDASRSSSTYQNDAPVQQRATQMYLYFYVGQFSQSATEQTAGLNSELFNGKLDIDANNATASTVNTLVNKANNETKETIVGWGMPDYSAGVSKLQTAGSTISSTVDGVLCVWLNGNINVEIKRNDNNGDIVCGIYGGPSMGSTCYFPIEANENYYVSVGNSQTEKLKITFYPYKGVN